MNKLHFALVGAASLALAACGSKTADTTVENTMIEENAVETVNAATENFDEPAIKANLQSQADALKNENDAKKKAAAEKAAAAAGNAQDTDDSDTEVNAM